MCNASSIIASRSYLAISSQLKVAFRSHVAVRMHNSHYQPEPPEFVAFRIEMCVVFAVDVSTHVAQPDIKTSIGKEER